MYKEILVMMLPMSLYALNLGSIDVITTQSREELSSSEAMSVDFVDASKAETYQVDTLSDLASLIPNLNISGIGSRNKKTFTLRGVSNYVAYQSSVAVYIDGIPLPFSYGYGLLDMNNITTVEFTKGAYGAIFGKGAQSGVMRVSTHAPSQDTQAKLSFELGSYQHQSLSGYILGATPYKSLNYSLSFNKEGFNGYSLNTLTGNRFDKEDISTINAKLHFTPSDDFDIALHYAHATSDDGGSPFTTNRKNNIRSIDDEAIDGFNKLQSDRLGLFAHYKWGEYRLSSSTSYVKQTMDSSDYIAVLEGVTLLTDTDIEEFTQDIELQRSFDNSDIKLGLFYSKKLRFEYREDQILWHLYPIPLSSKNSIEDPDEVLALSAKYNYYLGDSFLLTAGFRYQESQ